MPQEVVGPAPGLTFGIHICPAEKERLNNEVLELKFTRLDSLMNPLMARVEPPRMAAHGDNPSLFLDRQDAFRVSQGIGDGNFDFDMFSRPHDLYRLLRMNL